MAPTLPALLCLGEMGGAGGALFWRDTTASLLRQGTPGPRGSRGGEALLRAEGMPLTGRSLPGLSVGLRTQVQAGKSVPGPSSFLSWRQGSPPGRREGEGTPTPRRTEWESGRSGLRAGAWGDAW